MPDSNNIILISDPLRSDNIKALISQKPSFIERRASFLFIFIIGLVIAVISFIKYPTILSARGVLRVLNSDSLNSSKAIDRSVNSVVTFHVTESDSKRIKAGLEVKLQINGYLSEQFISIQSQIDSISNERPDGNYQVFSILSLKDINRIKLTGNGKTNLVTDIIVFIDNPSIIQRLIQKYF